MNSLMELVAAYTKICNTFLKTIRQINAHFAVGVLVHLTVALQNGIEETDKKKIIKKRMKVGRNFHLVLDQIQRSLSLNTFSNVLLLIYDT